MLTRPPLRERGTSLIEVLVTLLILSFALLGLAGLQAKTSLGEVESYQRAQAMLVMQDMVDRIRANAAQASAYIGNGTIGTGDQQPTDCTGIAPGPNRDVCEWSNELKGASEQTATAMVGTMTGARGCITQVAAPNPTVGICTAGVYSVSVAWQGTTPTAVSGLACGAGAYGANDALRRAVNTNVSIPTTSCF